MNFIHLKQIFRYLLIIAVLFTIFSLIVPWATVDAEVGIFEVGHVDFYTWGAHVTSGLIGGNQYSNWSTIFNPESFNYIFTEEELKEFALPFALYIAVFVLTLIIIIVGSISAYYVFDKKRQFNASLEAGVLAVLCLFFFYIFFNFGLFSTKIGLLLKPYFNLAIGFYFMLLSALFFFISFFLSKWSHVIAKELKNSI
jgi:hypothetical protein